MNRLKNITLLMFFIAIMSYGNNLLAQEMIKAIEHKVIPPSPSSAIFKKYMGEQPSLATGSVNVSIPLYELWSHGVKIPFSLHYKTSGIKVYDDPSPCGFGWALLPGMRVMRTIMGRPDEMFEFVGDDPTLSENFTRLQRCMTDHQANGSNPNLYDCQHDIFTFSLIDRNLTYILDKNDGNISFKGVGTSEYKIEADTTLAYISVTDATGVKYIFGGAYEYIGNNDALYKSAWMLTTIILPNEEQITMQWDSGHHTHPRQQLLGKDVFYDEYVGSVPDWEVHGNVISSTQMGKRVAIAPYYHHQHLTNVVFPGGEIKFKYKNNGSGPALDKMSISNGSDTIKTVTFEYAGPSQPESYLLKRVNLSDEGEYVFEYNPHRPSSQYALDWWGYCNNNTVQSLVPQMRIKCYDSPGAAGYYVNIGQANRNIDREKMQANILTSVTYPTGGTTEFEYEPHRFNAPMTTTYSTHIDSTYNYPLTEGGGLRVTRITTRTGANDPAPVIKRYVYGENEDGLANCLSIPNAETFINLTRTFNLDESVAHYLKPIWWYRVVSVGLFSNYMDYDIGQTPIWYSQVTEYSDEGKTVYQYQDFTVNNQFGKEYGVRMIQQLNKVFSKGPQKTAEYIYKQENGDYVLVQKQLWNYKTINGKHLNNYFNTHITRNISQLNYNSEHAPDFDENGNVIVQVPWGKYGTYSQQVQTDKNATYNALQYYINFQTERYEGNTTTIYTDNGEYSVSETYEYIDDTGILKTKNNAHGTLKLYYPQTIGSQINRLADDSLAQAPIINQMVNHNVIGNPIYTTLTYNGDSIESRALMQHYGNSLYLPYRVIMRRSDKAPVTAGTYNYDAFGNLTSRKTTDGVTETFTWGYSGRYPISHSIEGDLVSNFMYRPLVGMLSATSPRGLITQYAYDNSNRLSGVKIDKINDVQRFEYHRYDENTDAQTPWEGNYIIQRTMLNATGSKFLDRVERYDGLGRPVQTIGIGITPTEEDLSTKCVYDAMGRQSQQWLSIPTTTSGNYINDENFAELSEQFYGENYGYSTTEYEPSPREVINSITKAGEAWYSNGKSTQIRTQTNKSEGRYSCRKYKVVANGVLSLIDMYEPGKLLITETINEDGATTLEFKDTRGLTILIRQIINDTETADCYYVYDNLSDLSFVLPPMLSQELSQKGAVWRITDDIMSQYAYCYYYNGAGKCISKKLPGLDWITYKYDIGQRLVAQQDGNMRQNDEWLVRFYDKYGREVIIGIAHGKENDLAHIQDDIVVAFRATETADCYGYSFNIPLSLDIQQITKVRYYDDYDFISYTGEERTDFEAQTIMNGYPIMPFHMIDMGEVVLATLPPNGLQTGELSFSMPTNTPLLKVMYYDRRDNLAETHTRTYQGGMSHRYCTYTFTSKLLTDRWINVTTENDSLSIELNYSYDHAERLTDITHSLNGAAAVPIEHIEYDDLGRISRVNNGALETTYTHDMRSWLRSIENPRFKQELKYEDGAEPRYNGFISSMLWGDNSGTSRRYDYSYDGMGRLTQAIYSENRNTPPPGIVFRNSPDYSTSYVYDLNSNPTRVYRRGIIQKVEKEDGIHWIYGDIDYLWLENRGNQLLFIDDAGSMLFYENAPGYNENSFEVEEYTWDSNGNMTSDLNKGISSIEYNHLNLPSVINYVDGHREQRIYSTSGQKLRTIYQTSVTATSTSQTPYDEYTTVACRDYCDDVIYLNGAIEVVRTPNGYITPQGEYRISVKDNQGNVRLVTDLSGNVMERNNYYPYGGVFSENDIAQPYKYSGKEFENRNGLNIYDFHARYFDYAIPCFTTQDPLQEKYYQTSPYTYCSGDPINKIDPSGMEFTENAQSYANKLISASQKIINTERMSNETDRNAVNQALCAINEIIELRNSNQLYDVVEDNSLDEGTGATRANSTRGTIEIGLQNMNTSIDLIAHEFKHLYQFEIGEISFTDKNVKGRGYFLYDKTDEVEAYKRGAIFGGPQFNSIEKLPDSYSKFPNKQMNLNIFLKEEYKFSPATDFDGILRSRSKFYQQTFRYNQQTYFYKAQ